MRLTNFHFWGSHSVSRFVHLKVLLIYWFNIFIFSIVRCNKNICCPRKNGLSIELNRGTFTGTLEGVSHPSFQAQSSANAKCSYMATLRANFQTLTKCLYDWHQDGCVSFPMCGRRMLRIDMFLGDDRKGYMFNVGDSPSNNGWGKKDKTFLKKLIFFLFCCLFVK